MNSGKQCIVKKQWFKSNKFWSQIELYDALLKNHVIAFCEIFARRCETEFLLLEYLRNAPSCE